MGTENKVFSWFNTTDESNVQDVVLSQNVDNVSDETIVVSDTNTTNNATTEDVEKTELEKSDDESISKTAEDVEKEIDEKVAEKEDGSEDARDDDQKKIEEAKEEVSDTMNQYIKLIKENPEKIADLMNKIHEKQTEYIEQIIQKETNEKILKSKLQETYSRIAELENKEDSISIPEDHKPLYRSLSLLSKEKDSDKRLGKFVDSFLEVLEWYKSDLDFDAVRWSIYGNVVKKIDKKYVPEITQEDKKDNIHNSFQKKVRLPSKN